MNLNSSAEQFVFFNFSTQNKKNANLAEKSSKSVHFFLTPLRVSLPQLFHKINTQQDVQKVLSADD